MSNGLLNITVKYPKQLIDDAMTKLDTTGHITAKDVDSNAKVIESGDTKEDEDSEPEVKEVKKTTNKPVVKPTNKIIKKKV
jgi:hypothetical protein